MHFARCGMEKFSDACMVVFNSAFVNRGNEGLGGNKFFLDDGAHGTIN